MLVSGSREPGFLPCLCRFKLTDPISQIGAILICHPHLHILVLGSQLLPDHGRSVAGEGGKHVLFPQALQSDGCDVPSERWYLPSWPREGLSWVRGLTLALKQQSRHQCRHGGTSLWEAAFTCCCALNAGASFSLQGGDMDWN